MATNTGGLIDPKYQGALGSEEIKQNLQNEIARKEQSLGSYAHRRTQGAAWLAPYGNLAQSLAMRDESNANKYADLFNMRQQLAQANLMDQRRGQISNLFQGFDPDTSASLSALYQQNPEEALKKAAEIRAENAKLTGTQKENIAAGLTDEDIYRKTLGAEFDLGTFANKEGIKTKFDIAKSQFDKQLQNKLDIDRDKIKSDLDMTRELAVQSGKLTTERQLKQLDTANEKAAGSIQNLGTVDAMIDIINSPDFGSGTFQGNFIGRKLIQLTGDLIPGADSAERMASAQSLYDGLANKLILPDAKLLGANPSDRDAKILATTIGDLGENEDALLSKVGLHKVADLTLKAKAEFIANGGTETQWVNGEGDKAYKKFRAEVFADPRLANSTIAKSEYRTQRKASTTTPQVSEKRQAIKDKYGL